MCINFNELTNKKNTLNIGTDLGLLATQFKLENNLCLNLELQIAISKNFLLVELVVAGGNTLPFFANVFLFYPKG